MNSYSKYYNTIVIGVGGMGSATVYELAKRGQRVLGLEQFDVPHDMGSSHGYTRIIRLAYYEHPSYVMLLKRAYALWDEIERLSGEHLLHKIGSIDAGPSDDWVFKGSFQSVVQHGLDHEVLTGKELNKRFPGYQLPHDLMAVYQKDGGFLVPERATVAFANAAMALGAEIHGREEVLGWEPTGRGEGVRVTTNRATYEADSLVITAGAWNDHMLPFLNGLATPERQVLAWTQPNRPEFYQPTNFPVFNLLTDRGRYYGFPIYGVPGFKIGIYHHFEEHGDPAHFEWEPTVADEELLRETVARYFPEAAGPTLTLKTCMFTNSPDKHFLIDLHPDYPQVSFAAGFSGHGYKFASVIGEIMADLAERRETRHDVSLFNIGRFTGQISDLHRNKLGLPDHMQPNRSHHNRAHLPMAHRPMRRNNFNQHRNRQLTLEERRELLRRQQERQRNGLHHGSHPGNGRSYGQSSHYLNDRLNRQGRYGTDSTDPFYWEDDRKKPPW